MALHRCCCLAPPRAGLHFLVLPIGLYLHPHGMPPPPRTVCQWCPLFPCALHGGAKSKTRVWRLRSCAKHNVVSL
jgi:hypothetical protein